MGKAYTGDNLMDRDLNETPKQSHQAGQTIWKDRTRLKTARSLYGNIKSLQKGFVLNREENLEHVAYLPSYYTNPEKTALQSQLFNPLLS